MWKIRFSLFLLLAMLAVSSSCLAQNDKTLAVTPRTGPLAGKTIYTNSYALLIGVSHYQHLPQDKWLDYADKDAADLRNVLIQSYGFPAANVTTLLNEQATKEGILAALAALTSNQTVKPQDRVLIFFSGHGQTVKLTVGGGEMGFLIPFDGDVDLNNLDNPAPYLKTCLKMREIWDYLEACPAKHSLLLADACFSGLLAKSKDLGDEPVNAAALSELASLPARQVITAGRQGQVAKEFPNLGHGAFTAKLLERLRAAATEPGDVVMASELAGKLKRAVTNLTDGAQTPQFANYNTEGEFLFISAQTQTVPPLVTNTAETYVTMGKLYYDKKDHVQAEALFKKALDANPKYANAYNNMGNIYYKKKDYDQAETFYRKAIELDPKYANPHSNLGNIYHIVKKDDVQAEALYKEAIELDPKLVVPYENLGHLYYNKKDYPQAEKFYRKVVELDPQNADAYDNLGILYYDKKDYEQAETSYKKAIELDPKYANAYFHIGDLYYDKKEYAQAEASFKTVIEIDPKYAIAYGYLGNIYFNVKNDYVQAETFFRKAVELDPQDANDIANIAFSLYKQSKREEALTQARKAKELGLKEHPVYKLLGL